MPGKRYGYNFVYIAIARTSCAIIAVMFVFFLKISVFPFQAKIFLLAIASGLAFFLVLRGAFARFSLSVDDVAISALFLDMKTKSIAWRDVKKIRKLRLAQGYGFYGDSFEICDSKHNLICSYFTNLCGSVRFSQEIQNIQILLDQINLKAQEYSIPLVVWDLQEASRRRAKKITEVPISKLELGSQPTSG
jgi:hypothetical protein